MDDILREYELSDEVWALLEPNLPGQRGQWGGIAKDNRRFVDGVLWVIRTGSPWRNMPQEYGDWKNLHRRFCRWRDKGIWEKVLEILIVLPDFQWLLFDAAYAAAIIAGRGLPSTVRRKKRPKTAYICPWMRLVCRSELLQKKLPELVINRLI